MKRNRVDLQISPTSRRKFRVEDEGLLVAGAQVVEQLVEHQEKALVRMGLLERLHHGREGVLVVRDLARLRELVVHTELTEFLFDVEADDVAQAHLGGADLGTKNLESPGYAAGFGCHSIVSCAARQVRVFGDGGDQRHQM